MIPEQSSFVGGSVADMKRMVGFTLFGVGLMLVLCTVIATVIAVAVVVPILF